MTGKRLINWAEPWSPDFIIHEGKVWSIVEWTAATGISGQMIGVRLHKFGWNDLEALTTPIEGRRPPIKKPTINKRASKSL